MHLRQWDRRNINVISFSIGFTIGSVPSKFAALWLQGCWLCPPPSQPGVQKSAHGCVSTSSPEMLHRETTSEMPLAFGKYLVRTAAKKKTYLQGHYRHAWEMHKLKAACVYSYCNIQGEI